MNYILSLVNPIGYVLLFFCSPKTLLKISSIWNVRHLKKGFTKQLKSARLQNLHNSIVTAFCKNRDLNLSLHLISIFQASFEIKKLKELKKSLLKKAVTAIIKLTVPYITGQIIAMQFWILHHSYSIDILTSLREEEITYSAFYFFPFSYLNVYA